MQEIKFRGKCLESDTWIYGSLFNSIWRKSADGSRVCYIFPDDMLDDDNGGGDCWEDFAEVAEQYEVAPATVGQDTGLKDKNDKKIWMGDIFKDERGVVRSVFRVPGGFAFEDNPAAFGYDHRSPLYPYSSLADLQSASWLSQCCEVIGNIHDNPDLLKTE